MNVYKYKILCRARNLYKNRKFILGSYPNLLTTADVYNFFEYWFPNRSYYALIGAYSNKTLKIIDKIRHEKVSIKRIYKIEYLCISKKFEISYFKRHYRRTGYIYVD